MRHAEFLVSRYRAILAYTGLVSVISSLVILSPLAVLAFYPGELARAWGFLVPGAILAVVGLCLWRRLRPGSTVSLSMQEGAVIVVLSWAVSILVGAIPFLAVGGATFIQALFESTSGWTTAGLSVIDVERASPLILTYRSATQLAGGAGLAIIMLSALAGPVGPGLTVAEGRTEQLLPHVRRSTRLVLTLYAGYVAFGFLGLWLAGMGWFDALNHAFTAASTGGFSTRADSIAFWNSPAVEAVIVVLMLLGTLNFLTVYTLLQGRVRAVLRNNEVRQTAFLILFGIVILLVGTTAGLYTTFGQRLRISLFNTVSALSTTGFATVDYRPWNGLGWLLLIVFMLIGGGTGSTAGGIKQYRINVLFRGLVWEVRRVLLPRQAVTEPDVWKGEQRTFLTDRHLRSVALFVFLWFVTFFVGSGLLTAYGVPLQDSLFEFASAFSTVGISVGVTSASAPAGVLWIEMAAMILGRLEFLPIVIGVIRLASDAPIIVAAKVSARRVSGTQGQ